jgi:hypothetical protein
MLASPPFPLMRNRFVSNAALQLPNHDGAQFAENTALREEHSSRQTLV